MIEPHESDSAKVSAQDAHGQAELVRTGLISPTAPIEAAIARIEELDPGLNAVSHRAFDRALEAARHIDPSAPMAGIPYLLKASMEYPGFPAQSGSRFRKDAIGKRKWPFARKLDEAGLISLGASCMPEFGLIGTGEALLYGPTRNPWDQSRSSGGSSSGAAVAVATRIVPFATASDGGGSIRIPASHCGVVGFKPSRNWNLRSRAASLVDDLLASDALLARSMRDTTWAAHYLRSQPALIPDTDQKVRIAVSMRGLDGQLPDNDIRQVIALSAQLCAECGYEVDHCEMPLDLAALSHAFDILWSFGAGEAVDQCRAVAGEDADRLLEPWTLGLARRRLEHTPEDLADAFRAISTIDTSLARIWRDFDCVLSPVTSSTAPRLGLLAPDRNFEDLWRDHFRHVNYTQLQNMAGYPAISLPLFLSETGMPAGAMLWSRHGNDDLLLSLGATLEDANGFTHWNAARSG